MENANQRANLGSLALLMLTFSAVFNFASLIDNTVAIGLSALPGYLFGTIFYFLPFALMVAEFTSANAESESGIHQWISSALGPKWGFLGAWSYFFVNLFFFCSLVPKTLIYASYFILGYNVFDGNNMVIVSSIVSIIVFWIATFICIKGIGWMSKVTNIAGFAKIGIGVLFIAFAFIIVFGLGDKSAQQFNASTLTPKFDWTFFMVMAWIFQAVGGAESIGCYVKDIKGGNKAFVRTMITASLVIGGVYVLGVVAIGLIVPSNVLSNNFSNGIFDAFYIIGQRFGMGGIVRRFVGFVMLLCNLGSLMVWTAAPVKVLFSEIPEGIFGSWVVKTDDKGNPYNALILQAAVVSIMLMIPALGVNSMNSFLQTLTNMTASTALVPMLFFFAAYIVLRWKKDSMPRNFRLGGRKFGIAAGITLFCIFLFVFFMSTVPDPSTMIAQLNGTLEEGVTKPINILVYNIIGLVVFLGFAVICWNRYEKRSKKTAQAKISDKNEKE